MAQLATRSLLAVLLIVLAPAISRAEKPVVDDDLAAEVPAMSVPVSGFISAAAKEKLREQKALRAKWSAAGKAAGATLETTAGILQMRELADSLRKGMAQEMLKVFPVSVTPQMIGGVQTDVLVPKSGVAEKHKNRVLLNLHGGGFIFGARWEGQVASIPIAGIGGYKVITVDYRMGPEHVFPAASEDVAKVYAALLKQYPAENIGIYGCSAGGALTMQSVAWFQTHNLPRPGAVFVEGAGVPTIIGDSDYFVAGLSGTSLEPRKQPPSVAASYFVGTDMKNPLVSPVHSPTMLGKFPPTLIINATRDPGMSGALYTHTQLVKAGVDADLHVWEGMGHCFTYDHALPESREAYDVSIRFFDRHLGK